MANYIEVFSVLAIIFATVLAALAQDCSPEGAQCVRDSECCYNECIDSLCQP
uniref:U-Asilidin(1)-Mar1a n=1 Tax=Machimus arthriticus TaxID=1936065 RepID=ASI1A_MACAT|nr:RecName: Full=U-Asilidin(1)-Mar1a; Flags: Precursor [Machimus arthriticus]